MVYLISIFIFIILLALFFYLGKKPYIHKVMVSDSFNKYLKILLNRGYNQGILFIEIPKDNRFLQFRKYIDKRNSRGIELGFPLADWSEIYYTTIKNLLLLKNIQYNIQRTNQETVSEFINIDFKQDLILSEDIAKMILKDIFNVSDKDYVKLYFKYVSPKDEVIGE